MMVEVAWAEDDSQDALAYFPCVWLRDNCQCPECYNLDAKARSLRMKNLDVKIEPVSINSTADQVSSTTDPPSKQKIDIL